MNSATKRAKSLENYPRILVRRHKSLPEKQIDTADDLAWLCAYIAENLLRPLITWEAHASWYPYSGLPQEINTPGWGLLGVQLNSLQDFSTAELKFSLSQLCDRILSPGKVPAIPRGNSASDLAPFLADARTECLRSSSVSNPTEQFSGTRRWPLL